MIRRIAGMLVVLVCVSGCMGRHSLDRKPVKQISEAEVRARSSRAFERARERVAGVEKGMSPDEVQAVMGAVIAVEEGPDGEKGDRRKLMDGFLCKVNAGPLRERWLFGYDEGSTVLVGFGVEFERPEEGSERWTVRRVDRAPQDDCPIVGDTQLE